MKFLKGLWNGVKKGFNFVKKHKVLSFLLGGLVLGTVVGMAVLGAPFLPALIGAAAVTGGALLIGGAIYGTGVIVGGLVITAAMGIGGMLGLGKDKKDPEQPTPIVDTAEPGANQPTPITVLPDGPNGHGLIQPLSGDKPAPVLVSDAGARNGAHRARLGQAETGQVPAAVGLTSVLADDVPVTPTPVVDADDEGHEDAAVSAELPPEAKQLPTPVVDLPLGESTK